MDVLIASHERQDKRRGTIASIIFGILVIILMLLPLLNYPDPPPEQAGVLVNLGLPDMGQGNENAGPATPAVSEPEPEEEEPEREVEKPQPKPQPQKEAVSEPKPPVREEVVTTEDPDALRIREEQRKADEARRRQEQEAARQQAEAEAKRKAAEEAERQRQEEEARKQAEADKLKDQLGGLFGKDKGKGETGNPGNQGDPDGDPDASKLEGISTGSGTVGGGLQGRGVLAAPKITDKSQDQGVVVVRVCVDRGGNVVSAEFTQKGTTATSARLQQLAVSNARKWKFSAGEVDKQCGTITYNFKVR